MATEQNTMIRKAYLAYQDILWSAHSMAKELCTTSLDAAAIAKLQPEDTYRVFKRSLRTMKPAKRKEYVAFLMNGNRHAMNQALAFWNTLKAAG